MEPHRMTNDEILRERERFAEGKALATEGKA